ncbi:hypothetical protein BX285_5042 [Streptomyces sp. 1114.5]|nr:hypothetical protein BX285_5042 [Streptomyces sp. 1114.5]
MPAPGLSARHPAGRRAETPEQGELPVGGTPVGRSNYQMPLAKGWGFRLPVAEHAHAHTIKLPVWHREQDLEPAEQSVRAAIKISDHHEELL